MKKNYETNDQELLDRCESFIRSTGAVVTKFCQRFGISPSMYYKWRSGETPLSVEKAAGINQFLESFGF